MDGDELPGEIAELEAHIEELAEAIERCRKFSLAAKAIIAAGSAWIALTLLLVVSYAPEAIIAAIAAVIIGVVLLGSNKTTWTQTETAMHASEAMRAELIARIELRLVGEQKPTLH